MSKAQRQQALLADLNRMSESRGLTHDEKKRAAEIAETHFRRGNYEEANQRGIDEVRFGSFFAKR